MPRGQPDYGITTQTPVASGISDPGEAAARLGSINIYDRRGWMVWMDDFEAPELKWLAYSSVGGTNPLLRTVNAWMGIQCVYFVTAAIDDEYSAILRRFPLVRLGRVGVEFFILLDAFAPGYFRLRLHTFDGVNVGQAELHLDSEAKTATIVTAAGDKVVATYCFNTAEQAVWTPVKLVVDIDTDKYTRLLIGPQEIDLSAHSFVAGADTTDKMLYTELTLMGNSVGAMLAKVDNFILTQNEP